MEHIDVSVVSPVYTAKPYLRQCLDSLAAQTLPNIEFICIDDGSTDDSLAVLNEYADHDARFRIITKPNAGYGATMNLGIELARGRYVGFLDPDDFTEPNTYERLFETAREFGFPDIVKANYFNHSDADGDAFRENYRPDLCGKLLGITEEPGIRAITSTPSIWAGIYRIDFLKANELRLTETPGVSYQDTSFVLKAWMASDSFAIVHDALHHYRIDNPNSSARASGNVFRVCDEFDDADAFAGKIGRIGTFASILAERRFATYEWNGRRIINTERESFVSRASEDLRRLRSGGRIERNSFSPSQWERMNLLMERPTEYYARITYGNALDATRKTVADLQALDRRNRVQAESHESQLQILNQELQNRQSACDLLTEKLSCRTAELESCKAELESCKTALNSCKNSLEEKRQALKSCKSDLEKQRQKTAHYKRLAAECAEKLGAIRHSKSYRIGRVCTWPARKVRRVTKR